MRINNFSNIIQTTVGITPTLIVPRSYKKSTLIVWYSKLTGALDSLTYNSKFTSQNPGDIAVDNTRIYVTDRTNNLVRIYNRFTYALITTFGGLGAADGFFNSPSGIDVDDLYIYVADVNNLRIQIFNKITLEFVLKIVSPVQHYGVAVDQNKLFRQNFNNTPGISILDKYSYVTESNFGIVATFRPIHIDYDDFYIYGASFNPLNVQRWTRSLPHTLVNTYNTGVPNWGIAVTDICFFVSCYTTHVIRAYDFSGNLLGTIGNVMGVGDGQFNTPLGIYLKDGLLFVADSVNNRIQVFNAILVPNVFIGRNNVRTDSGFALSTEPNEYRVNKDIDIYGIANTSTPISIIQNFEEEV